MYYLGLDLGTGGLKGLLVDEKGKIKKQAFAGYPSYFPCDGWSEQRPEDWLSAAKKVIGELSLGVESEVECVGISGQMHGLVVLGKNDEVLRPAILWNDGRAQNQADFLNEEVGRDKLSELTANIAYAGFTAPKIMWLRQNERQIFAKIAKIMLPKDYLVYMLTGAFVTDYSDASGTLLLDVKNKTWSRGACDIVGIKTDMLPELKESFSVVGKVNCLPNAVMVAGAGDNAASAVGTGAVEDGDCNISLGTSGTLFVASDKFHAVFDNSLHNFVHATGKWHFMGCILSAASCNKWWLKDILGSDGYENAVPCELADGSNKVFFLPYLMGERSPHNDASARAAFIGMRANTTREQLNLAVLEGVAFALRDCLESAKKCGVKIKSATICGGGAKSGVWKKIIANVLNIEVLSTEAEEGASFGAALLAMIGCGKLTFAEVKNLVKIKERIAPVAEIANNYDQRYLVFKSLYPSLKSVFGNF